MQTEDMHSTAFEELRARIEELSRRIASLSPTVEGNPQSGEESESTRLENQSATQLSRNRGCRSSNDGPGGIEEFRCCICLNEESDLTQGEHVAASIDGCEHRFCFGCIEEWAQHENTCPLCKSRFTFISSHDSGDAVGGMNNEGLLVKHVETRNQSQSPNENEMRRVQLELRAEIALVLSVILMGDAGGDDEDDDDGDHAEVWDSFRALTDEIQDV